TGAQLRFVDDHHVHPPPPQLVRGPQADDAGADDNDPFRHAPISLPCHVDCCDEGVTSNPKAARARIRSRCRDGGLAAHDGPGADSPGGPGGRTTPASVTMRSTP